MTIQSELYGLITRIAWDHDHRDGKGVADFFTEDGIYHPPGRDPIQGRPAIAYFFHNRNLGDRIARHVVTNVTLLGQISAEVEVSSIMTVYAGNGPGPHPAMPGVVLDCLDRAAQIGTHWLLKRRELKVIFRTAP
jgi:hypothetical protein